MTAPEKCQQCTLITGVDWIGDHCRASVVEDRPLILPDGTEAKPDKDEDDNDIPGSDMEAVAVPGPLCPLPKADYSEADVAALYENKL